MNQRRDSPARGTQLIIAMSVVLVVVLGCVYWFGIRDDDKDAKSPSGPKVLAAKTMHVDRVPFTFKYPGNFAETTGPVGFVFIAGVGPYDILDVKRLANNPTPLKQLRNSSREALEANPDVKILDEGKDARDGVDMVRFTVESTVNGLKLRSDLYYFSTSGTTWQFECESQKERATIDAACAQALSTFNAS